MQKILANDEQKRGRCCAWTIYSLRMQSKTETPLDKEYPHLSKRLARNCFKRRVCRQSWTPVGIKFKNRCVDVALRDRV